MASRGPETAEAVTRAVDFLAASQMSSGQFRTYGNMDETLPEGSRVVGEVFGTSLVLYTLGFAEGDKARAMTARGIAFLAHEKEGPGVWRYWTRRNNGKARRAHNLDAIWNPPDVEDTALVSLVLERAGISCARNRNVILGNRRHDGLLYTWIVPRKRFSPSLAYWQVVLPQLFRRQQLVEYWRFSGARAEDVDCGINANVLLYLGDRPETRPIVEYLVALIHDGREASEDKWYRQPLAVYYFISRAYFHGVEALGGVRDPIVARVQVGDGHPSRSALETALAVNTLLNFRCSPSLAESGVRELLETQEPDGSWPRKVLYGRRGGWSFGSEELTTGLCIEALTRYERAARPA